MMCLIGISRNCDGYLHDGLTVFSKSLILFVFFTGLSCCWVPLPIAYAKGEFEIQVVDRDTGQPLAVRMKVFNSRGRPQRVAGVLNWRGHFVFAGSVLLKLPDGLYQFEIERGPEYKLRTGNFKIERGATDQRQVTMERFATMKEEGWWSGDLHVARRPNDIESLMLAEDLHVAAVTGWSNRSKKNYHGEVPVSFDQDRVYNLQVGEEYRVGGALRFFHLPDPIPTIPFNVEFPCSCQWLKRSRDVPGVHIDVVDPASWDFPVWIASGWIHSIALAVGELWSGAETGKQIGSRPYDKSIFIGEAGQMDWRQYIYYQALNTGVRLPPSAGSASGDCSNAVGHHRVYVQLDGEFSYENWWEGLKQGRVVITNGPLLRPSVEGQSPGYVFQRDAGETLQLEMQLKLSTRYPVEYLELIQDGRVVHVVRLDQWAAKNGRLPPLTFNESGWFLVRAVAAERSNYRFASSGPYYVQIGDQPKISRKSTQFFLDWIMERARNIEHNDDEQKREVLRYHRAARDYWQQKLNVANAP